MSTIVDPEIGRYAPDTRNQRSFPHQRLSAFGPALALLAVTVIFAAINPSFLTPGNVVTILDQAAIPMVLAMGMTFVIIMGCIDLSVEGVMATSGLTYVLLSLNTTNSNDLGAAAMLIALVLGACFGVVAGMIHTRLRVPTFIVTLGLWYVGLGIATLEYGDAVTQLRDPALVGWISATSLGITNSSLIALAFVVLGVVLSKWTRFGRYAYAIGDNEEIAGQSGVPVNRYKIYIFAFAGVCAAAAGIIGSLRLGAGVVEVGSGQVFFTVAAVVVGGTLLSGGRGGVLRSFVGVLLLTVINNGLVLSGVNPNIQQALFGIIIIAAVVITSYRSRSRLRVVK